MKPRKILFALIAVMLTALCGTYLGLYFTETSANVGAEQDEIFNIKELVPDDEELDLPDEITDDEEESSVPTDPLELVNYGLDIYNNGAGSVANYHHIVYAKAATMGMEAESQQFVKGTMSYSEGKSLNEAFWYYEHNSLNEFAAKWGRAKEECKVTYTDKANDYVAVATTKNMNVSNQTYKFEGDHALQEFNYQGAIDEYKVLWADGFPLVINKNTARVTEHDSRSSKYYTKITVSYDVGKLPEVFLDYYYKNNGMLRAVYTNYEFTFVISKNTGKIKKIIRHEDFYVRVVASGWDFTMYCKTDCVQDFVQMNKKVEIVKPF